MTILLFIVFQMSLFVYCLPHCKVCSDCVTYCNYHHFFMLSVCLSVKPRILSHINRLNKQYLSHRQSALIGYIFMLKVKYHELLILEI